MFYVIFYYKEILHKILLIPTLNSLSFSLQSFVLKCSNHNKSPCLKDHMQMRVCESSTVRNWRHRTQNTQNLARWQKHKHLMNKLRPDKKPMEKQKEEKADVLTM